MNADFIPVVLGTDQNAYGMARSFHALTGKVTYAIGKTAFPATANSKIIKIDTLEPNLENDDVFVKVLYDFKARHEGSKILLVSCGDNYSRLLAGNKERLKNDFLFNCPDKRHIEMLSTKEAFYETCKEYGLDYPEFQICTYENHSSFAPPFQFPLIIKPSDSVAYWNCSFENKKKVFIVNNEDEFYRIIKSIYSSSYKSDLIVQDFIPGDDSFMHVVNCYCDSKKRVKLFALGKVLLEEHTPQGIGSYAAIINDYDEAIAKTVTQFLEKIEYTGFINIDMKYDVRDGKFKFFETNLRQGRSSFFVTAAGYNLAKYLIDDLVLNKETSFEAATNVALWSNIPKGVIFKYVKDPALKSTARRLIKEKKYANQLYYKGDGNIKRRVYRALNQINQYKKYKQFFFEKGSL